MNVVASLSRLAQVREEAVRVLERHEADLGSEAAGPSVGAEGSESALRLDAAVAAVDGVVSGSVDDDVPGLRAWRLQAQVRVHGGRREEGQ